MSNRANASPGIPNLPDPSIRRPPRRGFYARKFRRSEVNDLQGANFYGLQDEIQLLRVLIRRLMESEGMEDPQDGEEAFQRMRALRLSLRTLAFLLLAERRLSGGRSTEENRDENI